MGPLVLYELILERHWRNHFLEGLGAPQFQSKTSLKEFWFTTALRPVQFCFVVYFIGFILCVTPVIPQTIPVITHDKILNLEYRFRCYAEHVEASISVQARMRYSII